MSEHERDLRERLHGLNLPPAPESLHRALQAVVADEPPPARRGRTRTLGLLAVAALLVTGGALVMTGALAPSPVPGPSDGPAASLAAVTVSPTPAPSADPSPAGQAEASFPVTIDGLTVHTVSGLLEARASRQADGGPYALAGYWSYLPLMHSCVAPRGTPGELEIYCRDGEFGITEHNEPIMILLDPGGRVQPAGGPFLTPYLPEKAWVAPLFRLPPVNGQPFPPVPIVVVGHFDDPRAEDCRRTARQLCRDRFVVERIVQFEPDAVPTPGPTPSPTPFPFDSPPPLALDVRMCLDGADTVDFGFVGWMDGDELEAMLASGATIEDGATVAVAITREPVLLADRLATDGYQVFGRQVCFAREWEGGGSAQFDALVGSLFRRYPDGREEPTSKATR